MPESYTHTVNDILTRLKSALNIKSDAELAEVLNIKTNVLGNWKSRNSLDHGAIIRVCEERGIDLNWILKTTGIVGVASEPLVKYETKGIPLIPFDAMAGWGRGDISVLTLDAKRYNIPEFNNTADFLIRISGTSMSPKYHSGDIVACKNIPLRSFLQWGKVYVMDTEQGPLCKRIFAGKREGYIQVVSENREAYPPFEISFKEVRALAIVVGVIRIEM